MLGLSVYHILALDSFYMGVLISQIFIFLQVGKFLRAGHNRYMILIENTLKSIQVLYEYLDLFYGCVQVCISIW